MMKGTVGSSAAAVMQESFACAVSNRFCQLLDDESDPFDILHETERRQKQRQKHTEAAAAGRAGPGGRAGGGKRESQKCRQPGSSRAPGGPPELDQKQAPKRGEQQGFNNRAADVKQDKTEGRPSFREYCSYGTERQVELTVERSVRGCGRGRDEMQGRGRGGGIRRSFYGFDQRGKWESERLSESDKIGMEQTTPMEETAERAGQPGTSEEEPLNKVAEGKPIEEVVQEMTLDEWKILQQQNRPKPEFNIRKPESTVPSKAVVIHKSKCSDLQKENFERYENRLQRPLNDITYQLDINFGSLPCPGRGSRGARGSRGRGRKVEGARLRPEVVVHLVAPNPDDPEDFPALS